MSQSQSASQPSGVNATDENEVRAELRRCRVKATTQLWIFEHWRKSKTDMLNSAVEIDEDLTTSAISDQEVLSRPTEGPKPNARYILPPTGWSPIDFGELIHYRELLYFLVWRDFKVRYKQTSLGVAWALLQPVFSMIIFTVIFGKLAGLNSDGYPYSIYVYAGLLPWTFFASGVNLGGMSLVNQQQLLTKVYFPRLFVPTAAVGIGLVDMLIAGFILAGLMMWYGQPCTLSLLALPGLVLLLAMVTLGVSYLFASLTVSYRDFRFVIPFLMQAMMYLSPVVYSISMFPQKYQWVVALNPMAGIIDGFRSCLLGKPWNLTTLSVSAIAAVVLFLAGIFQFRRTEQYFADLA
ncbi:MAG: ABC transporter permease [Planctomycetota bacterium]|nr:ABC transporter permease [Planctomycetota bacterium]